MKTIKESVFIEILSNQHLLFDKECGYINFPEKSQDYRFWLQPPSVPRLVYMVRCFFSFIEPWKIITVFRQGRSWTQKSDTVINRVQNLLLKPFHLPSSECALTFSRSEFDSLVALFTIQQLFGMCMWDDTYAIPDHARQMLRTSHHDVIFIDFRKRADARAFVAKMKREKFELPMEVPDGTFRTPHWMNTQ